MRKSRPGKSGANRGDTSRERAENIAHDRVTSQLGEIELLAKAMAMLGEGVMISSDHQDWLDSRVVFANEAFCRMVGYTLEELLGQTPQKLLGDHSDSVWSQLVNQELLTRRIYSGEQIYYRKDGSRCDVEVVITPIFDSEQYCTNFVSVQRDIGSRKKAEEILHDREERLQAILNTAPDAIITIDLNGIVQDCNPAVSRAFGYSSEQILGNNVSMLMPAPFRDEHDSYLRRYQNTGKAHIIGMNRQLTARHRDGHTFPITLSVSEVDHRGLYLGVIQDETDMRRLQREVLRTAGETRWDIGQALHDGPQQALAGLGLQARGLAQDLERASSPYASQMKKIRDQLQQANSDIRRLSRGLVPVRVSSGSLMSALEELAKNTSENHEVVCEFHSSDSIRIHDNFTADQLYHIAQEAITNAVKHSEAEHIYISLESQERAISMQVTDNGTGFDRTQIESPGLGLQIMPYRAATIGADFSVSQGDDGGTVVSCNLYYVDDLSLE